MGRHPEIMTWPIYRKLLLLACLAVASGCGQSQPAFELSLVDGAASCDANGCKDASGTPLQAPRYRGHAWYTLGRSVGGEKKLPYWHADISMMWRRPGKVTVVLDMSLPLPDRSRVPAIAPPPKVRYEEVAADGTLVFRAQRASGRVELTIDDSCPCQTGRIELLLRDAGPDGKLDTPDDRLRRITRARLRRDDRPFCHRSEVLPIKEKLLVVGVRGCPRGGGGGGAGGVLGVGACAFGGSGWFADDGWNDDDWYESDWVGPYRDGWDDGWGD
ncbi:MAG: hypothetical protein KC503_37190, partial [Myxococcales bacterium]|nr:hypothetical protein [Myxococcales bacterium]